MTLKRVLAVLLLGGALPLMAARAQVPVVELNAVPEYPVVSAGTSFRVAVRLRIPDGWHIYWINPGATGLPTSIAWRLPAGVTGGLTEWPYPEADAGADVTHVYRGTVVLFSSFTAEPGLAGTVALSGDLTWGICRVECVQQTRAVTVSLRAAREAAAHPAEWAEAVAATRLLPMREPGAAFVASLQGDSVRLGLTGLKSAPAVGSWVTYFPLTPGKRSVVVSVRGVAGGITLTLPRAAVTDAAPGRLAGVLVAAHAPGSPPPVRAIAVDVPITK